jgi:preprotein translocase subunit SecF
VLQLKSAEPKVGAAHRRRRPQVGGELREKGFLFHVSFILAYIGSASSSSGVSAILAAMHTPIMILLLRGHADDIDLTVLAAVLAVVGYQINDTVVVFDRARERSVDARRVAGEVSMRHQPDSRVP